MLCLNLSSILVSLYCYVLLARFDFYWQGQTQSNTQSQHSLNRGPNKRIPLWKVYALGIEIFEMSYIQLEVVDSLSTGQKARSEDFKQVIQQFSMISCLFVSSEVVLLVCGEYSSPFALRSVHELIVLGNSVWMGRKWSDIWNQCWNADSMCLLQGHDISRMAANLCDTWQQNQTKPLCKAPDFRQRAGLDSRPPSSYRTCGQASWMLHALNQELRFIHFSLKDGRDQEVVTLHLRIEWCIISTHFNSFPILCQSCGGRSTAQCLRSGCLGTDTVIGVGLQAFIRTIQFRPISRIISLHFSNLLKHDIRFASRVYRQIGWTMCLRPHLQDAIQSHSQTQSVMACAGHQVGWLCQQVGLFWARYVFLQVELLNISKILNYKLLYTLHTCSHCALSTEEPRGTSGCKRSRCQTQVWRRVHPVWRVDWRVLQWLDKDHSGSWTQIS